MVRFAVKLTEVTLNYSILDQLEAFSITGKGKTSPEAQMCKLLCQLQHFLPGRHNFTQMTGTQTVAAVKLGAFARNVPTAPAQTWGRVLGSAHALVFGQNANGASASQVQQTHRKLSQRCRL